MIKNIVAVKLDSEGRQNQNSMAMLVQIANKFSSSIYLEKGTTRINAKSIMGMMAFVMPEGEEVIVEAFGDDEEEASTAFINFLTGK